LLNKNYRHSRAKSTTFIDAAMNPAQCRAARALLGITQGELAVSAGLGLSTVVDFEKGRRQVSENAIRSIEKALEEVGITFSRGGVGLLSTKLRSEFAEPPPVFGNTHVGYKSDKVGILSSAQIRAARALLRWGAADLARHSALGVNTVRRAEAAEKGTSLTAANELAIRRALEAGGVLFIDEDGAAGPGVRLRKN
jgi:transcriptional regulator with XRE-family HTH domain